MARIACMLTILMGAVPITFSAVSGAAAAGGNARGASADRSASGERTSKTIPRGARILRISVHGSLAGERPMQRPLLVTSVKKIDEVVALLGALPAAQPGIRSCPADFDIRVRLAFYTGHGTTPLALAEADPQGCGGVRLTIGDKPQLELEGGRSLIRRIDRVLGVELDVSPVSATLPMIRQAQPRDREGVLATVTAAFAQDPGWAFLMGEEYQRLAPEFVGALFDLRAPGQNVWVSDDLATVAMWESPGGDDDEQWTRTKKAWARYVSLAGEEAHERLVAYKTALAAVCPADPYWYLGVLATHPTRQGEGLATAVLAPVLNEADRLAIPCCLETSTEENRRFYERRGFEQAGEIILRGGPDTWWLRRDPKGMSAK